MVRVWVAGKTVIPCNTQVISERFRDQFGIIKSYSNGLFTYLLTYLLTVMHQKWNWIRHTLRTSSNGVTKQTLRLSSQGHRDTG